MTHPQPEIFISATTGDLGTCRKMIKEALLTLGCLPVEQANFPPAAGLVREMLRKRITGCHAVIHVVGEVYGTEPQERSETEPRRSYTQLEYEIARELHKDVYIFICDQEFPYDEHSPEGEEQSTLQRLHRDRLSRLDTLYEHITSSEQLENRIYALPIRVEQLTKVLEATQKERDEAKLRIQQTTDYKTLKENVKTAKRNIEKLPRDPDFRMELQQAEQELNNFIESIRKLLDDIDKIPLCTERGKKAKAYFEEGNYQAAREILDANIMGQEKQALLKKNEQIKKQLEESSTQISDLAAEFLLSARLAEFNYQLGDQRIPTTQQYYEEALELSYTPQYLCDYACFLQSEKKFDDAEKIFLDALPICRDLAKNDLATYLPGVAIILTNLGNIASHKVSLRDQAEAYYRESIEIFLELTRNNIDSYRTDEASTRTNLGLLISDDRNRFDEARKLFEDTIKICRDVHDKNKSVKALYTAAGAANNLCKILIQQDREIYFDFIEILLNEALKIYESLVTNNHDRYQPDKALMLNNLGNLVASDSRRNRHGEAEKIYHKALKFYRELAKNKPEIYLPEVGVTLRYLGRLVALESDRQKEAEKFLQEALAIYRKLAKSNLYEYLAEEANTLELLGGVNMQWKQPKKALRYFRESGKLYLFLAQQDPSVFSERLKTNKSHIQDAIKIAANERKKEY